MARERTTVTIVDLEDSSLRSSLLASIDIMAFNFGSDSPSNHKCDLCLGLLEKFNIQPHCGVSEACFPSRGDINTSCDEI